MAAVWAEMQARVEELAGQAGLQILRAILENEVTRRVGPPHRPNPSAGCVRWGKQPGYVVFSEGPGGTTAGANARRPRSGVGKLSSVAAGREIATSRAGRCGGRAVHAKLSTSRGERSGRLRDREEQREPTIRCCERQ